MKFPVFSLLTGNFGLPETSSLLTASSSRESGANLIFGDESHQITVGNFANGEYFADGMV
jgi:hypothetical protein